MENMTPDNENTRINAPLLDSVNVWFEKIYEPTMYYMLGYGGRLDEKLLEKAVLLTIEADPYLSSRYLETEDEAFWEKMPKSSFKPYFTLQKYPKDISEIFENPPAPVDVRSAPQIRLDLYRDETGNRGDILVFALHHGFADAHGNISVASAVMNTYIRLAEDPGYVPKYKGRYPRDTKTIPERFTPEQREEAAKLTEISFEPNWSFVCGDVSRGKIFDYTGEYPRGGKRFSVRTISPENFRKIKAFGKRNGATINDLMVGAFLLSLLKSCGCVSDEKSPKCVLTAGDIRRYYGFDIDDNPMNMSVAFTVTAPCDENTPLKAILPKISETVRRHKNGIMGLGFICGVEKIRESGLKALRDFYTFHMDEGLSKCTSNPVFSNIGILDTRSYDTVPGCLPCGKSPTGIKLEYALFMPVISHAPGFSVIVSTYGEQMTLVSGYEDANTDRGRVEALLADMEERLVRESEEE